MAVQAQAGRAAEISPPAPEGRERPMTFRRWLAAVLLACVFLVLTALAVRHVELMTGRYVTTGVPPVPAVAALLLLAGAASLLRRLPSPWRERLVPDRKQILLTFSMVCIGAV